MANEWTYEALPVHGWRILNENGSEIVRDIYDERIAQRIVREHNAVAFAIRSGANWILIDWQNWRVNHAMHSL